MKLWINHPACTEPVGISRWLAFHVGETLEGWGRRLSWWAIDPEDDIPF